MGLCVVPEDPIDPSQLYIVFAGNAARSMLYYRMHSNDEAERMPLLGRTVRDEDAVQLIGDWIDAMPQLPITLTSPPNLLAMKRTILLLTIGLAAWQLQAQNTCATAIPVGLNSYYVSQIDGTEAPSPVCAGGSTVATMGEWYSYTSPIDTAITVTTDLPQNNGGDTRIHIYTGSCGNLVCYAGSDDIGGGNYLSSATFNAIAGTTYIIAFDNRWNANGFTFKVMKATPAPPVLALYLNSCRSRAAPTALWT